MNQVAVTTKAINWNGLLKYSSYVAFILIAVYFSLSSPVFLPYIT